MSIMSEAKAGVPDVAREVAKRERISPEKVARGIASGRIVVPRNPIHSPGALGVGEGLAVKVNVNLGTSEDCVRPDEELEKARIAIKYGADTIMDLSTGGDIDEIRRMIINSVNVPIESCIGSRQGLNYYLHG